MPSQPPPPKTRSNPPPSPADAKRADAVLDRMLIGTTLPKLSDAPREETVDDAAPAEETSEKAENAP
jgi:hypothetical protein